MSDENSKPNLDRFNASKDDIEFLGKVSPPRPVESKKPGEKTEDEERD